eukprot:CAMPEP_0170524800 /NCGR_PEP_ID=MMETSP0209-20121228/10259_1 /TAXON_ID=665100 ORGANISM="Litonotus pictus, Strain P1" /NCGR_SAMPLE_ID=MMETSP0209 /ASSEMBLY_ACC=CAM_ASM_000301 /LENGTH=95 /DNA_ID=CAMNT_0010813685 /DNA_START=612 /DNA_END=896 /DNA_ORIENTATION=-
MVFDFKLGNDPKKGKEEHTKKKVKLSTSSSLGFRLMGAQVVRSIMTTEKENDKDNVIVIDKEGNKYPEGLSEIGKNEQVKTCVDVLHKYICRKYD